MVAFKFPGLFNFFNFCLNIFFWKDSRLVKPELSGLFEDCSEGESSSESESSRDLASGESVLVSGSRVACCCFLFLRRMSGEFKNDLKKVMKTCLAKG